MWKQIGEANAVLKNLIALLKSIKELLWLAGSVVTGLVLWWMNESGPKGQVALLPPLLTVALTSAFVWRRKRRFTGKIVTDNSLPDRMQEREEWRYSPQKRRISGVCMVLFSLLTVVDVVWIAWLLIYPVKSILVVADFEGPEPQNYRVTENLVESLKAATR